MALDAVHDEMRSGLEQEIFTAAALLVIHRDQPLLHETYGTIAGPGTTAVHSQTLFDAASLTKVLATAPMWMLLESQYPGLIDRSITHWFADAPPDKAAITPRLLLAHASGLPAWRPYYLMRSSEPHAEEVRTRILSESLIHSPGRGCVYSDLGFMLLGFILEKETGEGLDVNSRNKIYRPLGLHDIMFLPRPQEHRIARTRVNDPPGFVNDLNARALGGVAGHAGLFASVEAAGRLAQEFLRSHNRGGFFNSSIVRMFFRRPAFTPDSTRALGFDTPAAHGSSCGNHFSDASVGHTGFTGVSLWIDIHREIVALLFTNRVLKGESDFRIKDFRPKVYDAVIHALRNE